MIYVTNADDAPMMPCANVIGRLLLKDGSAKVIHRIPFTIKLLRAPSKSFMQVLTLGIDVGSKFAGFGVTDDRGIVYYSSEIELRHDIKHKMDRRRIYRRNRRSRKCRYRESRFDNRRNSMRSGRLSPTIQSKINSHVKEIKYINKILPISDTIIEIGKFDPHAIKNPAVTENSTLYQQGTLYGFANVKALVLDRDGYTCQKCRGRSRDKQLHCHHIIYRGKNGSDTPENLITLCKTCHNNVHSGTIKLDDQGKRKGSLNHATHQNIINKRITELFSNSFLTYGYVTKTNRERLGLSKSHCNDAMVISSRGISLKIRNNVMLIKKCVPRGDYKQTMGGRIEKLIPRGKISGFRKFDKVKYLGIACFIKRRRSKGCFTLMDISGIEIKFTPSPKASTIKRIESRKCWMVTEKSITS